MKKELFSFKNLLKFILIILFLLSISFIVEYNVKEYDKQKKNISNVLKESFSFLKDINAHELSNTNLFKDELKVKEDISKKLNEEMYTIDSPLIVNNPYGNNPFSAYLAFVTKDAKSINVVINGEYSYTSSESKEHILPVFYLLPDETNIISLNGIEIRLDLNIEYTSIDNNSTNLLYVYNDTLKAYRGTKQVMSLPIKDSNYKVLNSGNILYSEDNRVIEITPFGFINNIYYFNDVIIDKYSDSSNLYVLNNKGLLKVDKTSNKEYSFLINNPTKLDITDDYIIVSDHNNIIYFLNKNLELQFIFGDSNEYKDYMLKKNYYTKYLTNIMDFKYKDNTLYVIENNTLKILIINESNKSIRQYKTINNVGNSLTYEDKLILNNTLIENNKVSSRLNVESLKSYIKYPSINIDESTKYYFSKKEIKELTLDDNTVSLFEGVDSTNLDLIKIDNKLLINDSDITSIILLNEKGIAYEYELNGNRVLDFSSINDGKYFIYTKMNSKVYNVNRYIDKRS